MLHIQNMDTITRAGGVIMPAAPSFYSLPQNFDELADTVVQRVLERVRLVTVLGQRRKGTGGLSLLRLEENRLKDWRRSRLQLKGIG